MTRINVGIKPYELNNKLLLAELREIKRIPNAINSNRCNLNNVPDVFTLGTGHVKFFYDKLLYLLNRYRSLRAEAISRGFNVQDYSTAWDGCPSHLMNDYNETDEDRNVIVKRIMSKGFTLIERYN